MKKHSPPNYNQIYLDILIKQYPEKLTECQGLLAKNHLSVMDILELNHIIFGNLNNTGKNQKFRSYSRSDILHILDYQKKYNLNNSQVANHFKLSRNSVAKWKRIFLA